MVNTNSLKHYLDELFSQEKLSDYCPNGLQIEGRTKIKKIISGVTACQSLITIAIQEKADAILVHHGYFWKSELQTITGYKKNRIKALLENDINLFAYHLPLDVHPRYGNNVQLGKHLEIQKMDPHPIDNHCMGLLYSGHLPMPQTAEQYGLHLKSRLGRTPLHVGKEKMISQIAWCTGAGQNYIEHAHALGVDAFISGEISEQTYHFALENDLHYFAAGHHATERFGVQALGDHLAEQFDLSHQFYDVPNPV